MPEIKHQNHSQLRKKYGYFAHAQLHFTMLTKCLFITNFCFSFRLFSTEHKNNGRTYLTYVPITVSPFLLSLEVFFLPIQIFLDRIFYISFDFCHIEMCLSIKRSSCSNWVIINIVFASHFLLTTATHNKQNE